MSEQLTEQELIEGERVCEAATPGPWVYTAGILKHYVCSENDDLHLGLQELHPADGREVPAQANAEFVAVARTLLPKVLAEVRRLQEQEKRLCVLAALFTGWTQPKGGFMSTEAMAALNMDLREWQQFRVAAVERGRALVEGQGEASQ